MLIFIRVSVAKTMHLLSSHILPRNASDFTCSYLRVDLRNLPRGETPGPLLTKGGGGEGIKGWFLPLQEGEGRIGKRGDREGEREGRRRSSGWG